MQHIFTPSREHSPQEGVLLVNLGSPASPRAEDVKSYLGQFLMDRHVISLPYPFRFLLVRGIIVPRRYQYSASMYRTIWEEETGSFPLVTESLRLGRALAETLGCKVAVGMRYGSPSIREALDALAQSGVKKIKIMPLYPHETRSTTGSVRCEVERYFRQRQDLSYQILEPYFKEKGYQQLLRDSVLEHLPEEIDCLIVSYHGIPLSHLEPQCRKGCYQKADPCLDCYYGQTQYTTKQLIGALGETSYEVETAYQSRLGRHAWLEPYLSERLRQLPGEGKKRVAILAPSFATECLETLYELEQEMRELFFSSGGAAFHYIPTLSGEKGFIPFLANYIQSF